MERVKMYSISQISKILGVSRQSIYKKLDKPELQEHLKDTDKGKVINEEGFQILKGLFSEYLDGKHATVNEQSSNNQVTDNLQADYIASLKAEIDHLKAVLADQAQQTTNLTRLLENSQVLQRQQQDKILLLEESTVKPFSVWDIFKKSKK